MKKKTLVFGLLSILPLMSGCFSGGVIVDHNIFIEKLTEARKYYILESHATVEYELEDFDKTTKEASYNFDRSENHWSIANGEYSDQDLVKIDVCSFILNENPLNQEEENGHKYRYYSTPFKYVDEYVVQSVSGETEVTEYVIQTREYNKHGYIDSYKIEIKVTEVQGEKTTTRNQMHNLDISYKG